MAGKTFKYESESVTVRYDVSRCIHARECVRGLRAVFDPDRKPWIDTSKASADDIADVVRRCPTGSLTYERNDGAMTEKPDQTNVIVLDPGGPLFVRGDIELRSPDGEVLAKETRVALCRCGASTNKPYCDGSHTDVGFADVGHIGESALMFQGSDRGHPLTVTLSDNGPLLLRGPFSIRAAKDMGVVAGDKAALCRCGGSSNKPFCDGTHRRNGFESS